MDLAIGQGLKCSCLLVPRTSSIFLIFSSVLRRNPKVTLNRQIRSLERHLANSCQSNRFDLSSNKYGKILESNVLPSRINIVQYSSGAKSTTSNEQGVPNKDCYAPPLEQKQSIFQKMKQMTKDYWHILIPVHTLTSICWVAMFYTAVKNGVDVVGILESLKFSEKYLDMLRESSAGYWALTYALYKIFTPLRYMVTVGGTTISIKYLNRWGYLKFRKSPKLEQSIQCTEEHKAMYGKPTIAPKSSEPQVPKT